VKEGLFLGWITCQRSDVTRGNAQLTAFIEAYFANTSLAGFDETPVAACVALQGVSVEMFG
jgi:hypothetical protein